MSRRSKLGIVWRYCERHVPGVWKFHSKCGVDGYWGIAPIVIVGAEPSDATDFNGWMAQRFYDLLKEHGLAHAHITDARMTQKRISCRRHRYIFLAQLEVLQPRAVLVMDMSGYNKPRPKGAWSDVNQYLTGVKYSFAIHPIYHYSYMSRCGVSAWESCLLQVLSNIRTTGLNPGRTLLSTGWFSVLRNQVV